MSKIDENISATKKYKEMWNKIKYFIKLRNNDWDYYDDKYRKIKFESNNNLPFRTKIKNV